MGDRVFTQNAAITVHTVGQSVPGNSVLEFPTVLSEQSGCGAAAGCSGGATSTAGCGAIAGAR